MDSKLIKNFKERDVQRMRNIITKNTGDKTGIQVGYAKQTIEYKDGDVWEESGKQWTIKNGLKQTVTKFDSLKKLVVLPLSCPCCSKPMKFNDINKKMWSIHNMCFDCVIDMEAKIKFEGKWDEYESKMLNSNKNAEVNDLEASIEEFLKSQDNSYITEQGDVESWNGGKINEDEIKNVKEYIKNLREHKL